MTSPSSSFLYNQNTQGDEDFIAGFVARHEVLESLLGCLRAIELNCSGLHQIIIGSRGMGKTSLLRRIAIATNREAYLSVRFIPLSFREEQYNVLTLSDFWRNCGDALAEWAEANNRQELADRIDLDLASEQWRTDEGSAEAFEQELKLLDRRAVLLVDNLDIILGALSDEAQWKLRRRLQQSNGPVLIGAATQPLKECADPNAAFYEFFQPHYLEPLDIHCSERCMRALALHRGEHGSHVLEVLDTKPERLKTLHALTGGNPRVLSLIYRLLENAESEAAMSDLESLLDQVTPYYKSRIEEYQTPQQRAVIDAIALNWDPITTSELAQNTSIASTTLSPLLIKLRKDGLIEHVESSGSYGAHQLVERFLNIWYLMRHGTRRTKLKMRWFVKFLTSFFSFNELERIADVAESRGLRKSWHTDYSVAFEDALLQVKSIEHNQVAIARSESLDAESSNRDGESRSTRKVTISAGALKEGAELLERAASSFETGSLDQSLDAIDQFLAEFDNKSIEVLDDVVASSLFHRGMVLETIPDLDRASAQYEEVVARYARTDQFAKREIAARSLTRLGQIFDGLGERAAELEVYEKAVALFGDAAEPELRVHVALAMFNRGIAYRESGEFERALIAYNVLVDYVSDDDDLKLQALSARAQYDSGLIQLRGGEYESGLTKLNGVIEKHGDAKSTELQSVVARSMFSKGVALRQYGNLFAAHNAFGLVVERFGNAEDPSLQILVGRSLFNKGYVFESSGDYQSALDIYNDLIARYAALSDPEMQEQVARALSRKGAATIALGDRQAGLVVLRSVIARFRESPDARILLPVVRALQILSETLQLEGDFDGAIDAYEQILPTITAAHDESLSQEIGRARIALANLVFDVRGDLRAAEALFAESRDTVSSLADANLAWVYLLGNKLSEAIELRQRLTEIPATGLALIDSALEFRSDNFGSAVQSFADAIVSELETENWSFTDDLDRLFRLVVQMGYGERLIEWFEGSGFADRVAPVYVAFKAYVRGENVLLDANPEVRQIARITYDRLDRLKRYKQRKEVSVRPLKKPRGRPRKG